AHTQIYTLSLHDALPISNTVRNTSGRLPIACSSSRRSCASPGAGAAACAAWRGAASGPDRALARSERAWLNARRVSQQENFPARSEEHTSELQSLAYLVC